MWAFYNAALFLKARVINDGWAPSSNYLREHVRCAYHLKFTNTKSPKILRALVQQHPELEPYIGLKPLKTAKFTREFKSLGFKPEQH